VLWVYAVHVCVHMRVHVRVRMCFKTAGLLEAKINTLLLHYDVSEETFNIANEQTSARIF